MKKRGINTFRRGEQLRVLMEAMDRKKSSADFRSGARHLKEATIGPKERVTGILEE